MMRQSEPQQVVIIVNSIAPYCFELNNILCLPTGFDYRFRYQKGPATDWMPTIANPKDIEGKAGLIVLRVYETGRFIPVRKILIQTVQVIGDVIYIKYSVDRIVELSPVAKVQAEQLDRFQARMSKAIGKFQNKPNDDLQNLILFSSELTSDLNDLAAPAAHEERENHNWGKMVRILGQLDVFKDIDFLRLVEFVQDDGRPAGTSQSPGGPVFVVYNQRTYRLAFLQRTFTLMRGDSSVISPRDLVLRTDEEVTTFVSRINVSGKYDLLSFIIRPQIRTAKKNSLLFVEFERKSPGKPLPSIQIPIRIKTPQSQLWLTVGATLLFAAGAVLLFVPQSLASVFTSKPSPDAIAATRNILIVLMLLTVNRLPKVGQYFLDLVGPR